MLALAVCWKPLGDYMAHVFTSTKDLAVERITYRVIGVDSSADQRWPVYARSVLAFSLLSVVARASNESAAKTMSLFRAA